MANEIQTRFTSGTALYAVVLNPAGLAWNGSGFEAPVTANWSTYAVSLAEQGTTGIFEGSMPAVAAGMYGIAICKRAGGSPAATDVTVASGNVPWAGTGVQLPVNPFAQGTVADTGPAAGGFKGSSGLSSADGFYTDCALIFIGGALAGAPPRRVTAYTGATRLLSFANPFPVAPANGDPFVLIGRLQP